VKFLPLVWAALRRRPIRSILTLLAVSVAFLLFGVMHGVVAGFGGALDKMNDARLRVMSRANILEPLPIAYRERIARIPGVRDVTTAAILIGYYQDPKNSITAAAFEMDSAQRVFPELKIPDSQRTALRESRTAAVAGVTLAERYGWKIGDRITVISPMWPRVDGSNEWTFELVAIANAGPDDERVFANELYFHYEYFDEARIEGRGTVHQFAVTIDDPSRSTAIAQAIDDEFANSSNETSTLNDKEYVRSQIAQIGDIGFFVYTILGAVLFTLLFLTGNTMMQSVRDRTAELAVLKSVGFSEFAVFTLVFAEALVLCVGGSLFGLGIAATIFPSVFAAFGIPDIQLPAAIYVHGAGLAALLAALITAIPSYRARHVAIAAALAR